MTAWTATALKPCARYFSTRTFSRASGRAYKEEIFQKHEAYIKGENKEIKIHSTQAEAKL